MKKAKCKMSLSLADDTYKINCGEFHPLVMDRTFYCRKHEKKG